MLRSSGPRAGLQPQQRYLAGSAWTEPDDENIELCKQYLEKMKPMNMILEMEIGARAPLGRSVGRGLMFCHFHRSPRRP